MQGNVTKYFNPYLLFSVIIFSIIACKSNTPKVATAKVGKENIVETIIARGNIYPVIEAYISTSLPGTVSSLSIQEGDTVTKGQIVGYITTQALSNYANIFETSSLSNAPQSLSALNAIESALIKSLNRIKQTISTLPDSNPLQTEAKAYQNELTNSIQNIQSIKQNLLNQNTQFKSNKTKEGSQKTALVAPMSGVVTTITKKNGESIESFGGNQNLITIANLNAFEARININEKEIGKLKKGHSAEIVIDAFENKTIKGVVTHIAGSIKQSNNLLQSSTTENNNVAVKILLDKATDSGGLQKIISGMNATVTIKTNEKKNVLVVPITAITSRVNNTKTNTDMVFVVYKNNKVFLKPIATGLQDVQNAEITNGLNEGDEIIIAPFNTINNILQDGMKIRKSTFEELFKK